MAKFSGDFNLPICQYERNRPVRFQYVLAFHPYGAPTTSGFDWENLWFQIGDFFKYVAILIRKMLKAKTFSDDINSMTLEQLWQSNKQVITLYDVHNVPQPAPKWLWSDKYFHDPWPNKEE